MSPRKIATTIALTSMTLGTLCLPVGLIPTVASVFASELQKYTTPQNPPHADNRRRSGPSSTITIKSAHFPRKTIEITSLSGGNPGDNKTEQSNTPQPHHQWFTEQRNAHEIRVVVLSKKNPNKKSQNGARVLTATVDNNLGVIKKAVPSSDKTDTAKTGDADSARMFLEALAADPDFIGKLNLALAGSTFPKDQPLGVTVFHAEHGRGTIVAVPSRTPQGGDSSASQPTIGVDFFTPPTKNNYSVATLRFDARGQGEHLESIPQKLGPLYTQAHDELFAQVRNYRDHLSFDDIKKLEPVLHDLLRGKLPADAVAAHTLAAAVDRASAYKEKSGKQVVGLSISAKLGILRYLQNPSTPITPATAEKFLNHPTENNGSSFHEDLFRAFVEVAYRTDTGKFTGVANDRFSAVPTRYTKNSDYSPKSSGNEVLRQIEIYHGTHLIWQIEPSPPNEVVKDEITALASKLGYIQTAFTLK